MDFGPLRKILELEQSKGYEDSAVIGGLDRFLQNWTTQAEGLIPTPHLLRRFRRLIKVNYASLPKTERRRWLHEVRDFITELETGTQSQVAASVSVTPVPRKSSARKAAAPAVVHDLDMPATGIRGISSSLGAKFAKLGVRTVRDILYFFPHRHIDYSQLKFISQLGEGEEQTIVANIWQAQVTMLGGRRGTEAIVGDETGNIRVVWYNQPYLAKKLATNDRIVLSGRVSLFKGRPVFQSPEWEPLESPDLIHTARLVPVYPLTQGLHQRQVRKLLKEVVDQRAGQLDDFLPNEMKRRCNLLELPQAIMQAHFPEDEATKDRARVRLAFDELFLLQLGVMSRKRDWQQGQPGNPLDVAVLLRERFVQSLPFPLTGAQQRALREILADLTRPQPMSRLLQGDVGSGKTVVAAAALMVTAANGYQGAFMAPTEILAEQHFKTINGLLSRFGSQEGEGYLRAYSGLLDRPLRVALLIGDLAQAKKQEVQQQIASGGIDLVIGTHAIIQKEVAFSRLGLAVVDEQHRFGVAQRSALRQKGYHPHMLVMTATPIPRTLALTLYGDLDISIIDEMPPGRQAVKTRWLKPEQRKSAFAFIRKQVEERRQAFIICPLIEESEAIAAQAAVVEYDYLSREVFPDLKLGLLHGRLSSVEKDEVMQRFHAGELHILVSTPVVEVGIDVPNATVMLVESADRFGLSQLHQFRGRVGRGQEQSYCMLLAENPSEVGRQRLDIIERVEDGFVLAEEDLKLRGPGEFFGTRQSGMPDLRMAKLSDVSLLETARREAVRIFTEDPQLARTEHQPMVTELNRVWPKAAEWS
ncbi:ATP-dependent DNA helicase RecG [Chloroflexota bacterium]